MIVLPAVPGPIVGTAIAAAPLPVSETLIVAGALAFLGGFITAVLFNRLAVRRLGRTATALASHASEILEATIDQTWNAHRTAAATATAAERLESVTDAETRESAETLDRLAGRAGSFEDPGAPELARSLGREAHRLKMVAQVREASLTSIRDSLKRIEGMMRRTARSTQRLERIARKLNQRGLSLLRFAKRSPFRWTARGSGGATGPRGAGSVSAGSGQRVASET